MTGRWRARLAKGTLRLRAGPIGMWPSASEPKFTPWVDGFAATISAV
jgi:hypothetical protein